MDISHVVIGIVSAHHPEGLARVLTSLKTLTFTAHSAPTISVIVVGNEETGPTRQVAESQGNVTYFCEPASSVALARNRVLENLPPHVQALVWLDDNAEVSGEWLASLLATFAESKADIVLGPLVAELPAGAPEWLGAGGFFNRRRMADRFALYEGLNNCLMSVEAIEKYKLRLLPEWGRTGLSGSLLLRAAARLGGTVAWAQPASAKQHIPSARANFAWLWSQFNLMGLTAAYGSHQLQGLSAGLLKVPFGLGEILRGIVQLPLVISGQHVGANCLLRIAFGLGLIAGGLGAKPLA